MKKKINEVGYFNIRTKKNSILENAKYQDSQINKSFDKIELLTQDIRMDLLKKENKKNCINFNSIKKS